MAHSAERQLALRFGLTMVGWLACLFGWVCVLSFSSADPPADNVWPVNAEPANLCGSTGAWLAYYLFKYLGVGTYALLGVLTVVALTWPKAVRVSDPWLRLVGLALVCTATCAWGAMLIPASDKYLMSGPGGVLGAASARLLVAYLQTTGTHIVLSCAVLVGLILAADELLVRVARWLGWTSRRSVPVLTRGGGAVASAGAALATGVANLSGRLVANARRSEEQPEEDEVDEHEPQEEPRLPLRIDAEKHRDEPPAEIASPGEPPLPGFVPEAAPQAAEPTVSAAAPRPARPKHSERPVSPPADDDYKLPPIEILEAPVPLDKESIEILCREKAYILEQTLNEFRVGVQVVAIETGPVITVFELKLSPGIKVSQIASLSNDMARALKAPAVRVVAPLPGKNTIGIEVPNIDKEKVRLRDVIESSCRRAQGLALPLYLGKDASGQPLVSDLTRMPHLLIAGTTGSGKSICVNSLITSMLLSRSPSEVNMILVDPKMVELSAFNNLPHLMCPILTDPAKAETILEWATNVMDERYALLAEVGVRDIRGYNRLGRDGLMQRLEVTDEDDLGKVPIHLPYIVIIIDELADLMMTSAKEVEFNLCRLAQKSRAVGVHLIVSTQRPQANVVTGLIKSNLPCRVCFRVSSRLDSRIVLDQNGGETLMGQGDMLFLAPGTSKLMRAQGTFVSDEEIRAIVKHCREQRQPDFHPELVRVSDVNAGATASTERDELFDKAVEAVIDTGRGSVSLLQRRLTIGYGRASRLIDQMYDAGIVGEYKGSQAREVIVTREEWLASRAQRDREESEEEAEFSVE